MDKSLAYHIKFQQIQLTRMSLQLQTKVPRMILGTRTIMTVFGNRAKEGRKAIHPKNDGRLLCHWLNLFKLVRTQRWNSRPSKHASSTARPLTQMILMKGSGMTNLFRLFISRLEHSEVLGLYCWLYCPETWTLAHKLIWICCTFDIFFYNQLQRKRGL